MVPFSLPISLLKNRQPLDTALVDDLELLGDDETQLYSHVLGPRQGLGARTMDKWAEFYTSDRRFLRDSQRLIAGSLPPPLAEDEEREVLALWDQLQRRAAAGKDVDDFHSHYQFVDVGAIKWLNKVPLFLMILAAYNLGSPVISLVTPVLIMLVPFVVLRIRKRPISLSAYLELLRVALQHHALGKLFDLGSASLQQKFYISLSLGFYAMQVYQNVRSCMQFYANTTTVRRHVRAAKDFLRGWATRAESFKKRLSGLKSHAPFLTRQEEMIQQAKAICTGLPDVTSQKRTLDKVQEWGATMKAFYVVHQDPAVKAVLDYALDWCGYVENLRQIQSRLGPHKLQGCRWSSSKTRFKDAFFPAAGDSPVRNSYGLDKHILVTGPNAAGKTTLLKATLFNILLSQQIGYGFYSKAVLAPYDKIHCYINIPDTGGRDSLFQAEARRCKNILSEIESFPAGSRHFCVFDELYSGTNPYEAIGSAEAFLRYIGGNPNVSFVMTTHFLELCSRLGSHKRITNRRMEADQGAQGMEYSYKLGKGISSVRGGVEVLRALEYPEAVVSEASEIVGALSL